MLSKREGPAAQKRRDVTAWTACSVLFALVFLAFSPCLDAGFVNWDDYSHFLQNPFYRGLGLANILWMFMDNYLAHYVPLTWLTFGLDYTLWGMDPRGYHLTSLILHAVNTCLVFFLARGLFSRIGIGGEPLETKHLFGAFAAAALFGLHPLRVESVAWISERRDVLSGLFFLSSLLFYLRARTSAALACFLASVLSRESTVTLAAVIVILDIYPLRRLGGAAGWTSPAALRVWKEKIPFFIVAAFGSFTALWATSTIGYSAQSAFVPAGILPSLAFGLRFYIQKTVVPLDLAAVYEMNTSWLHIAAIAVLLGMAWSWRRRLPALIACWAAYGVILSPYLTTALSIVPSSSPAQDRFSYLSCLPWALLLAGAGARLWLTRSRRAPLIAASVIVLSLLMTLTYRQTILWQDSITLWKNAIAVSPRVPLPYAALAGLYRVRGELDEAALLYDELAALKEGTAPGHFFNGLAKEMRGDMEGARLFYRKALALDPSYQPAAESLAP